MKLNNLNRFWFALVILALAALACRGGQAPVEPVNPGTTETPNESNGSPQDDNPASLSQAERAHLISATVQIIALFEQNGELIPEWGGSGTIITKSGMILTNAHVAAPAAMGEPKNPDALVVAIMQSEDKPPTASYRAEVRAADGYLDIAVIQITAAVNGSPIDTASLDLPYVEIGNSTQIHIGDTVNIFGFPSIGGDTITFTTGNVSGFSTEDQIGERAWIKTDATIAGGNSGGLAADNNARIIGIPTRASSGADTQQITDCRQIQDTNGDGVVDQNDSCIPIGGFINALRPVDFALPLIQAAQNGKEYASPYRVPGMATETGSGSESWSNFIWLDTSNSQKKCETTGNTVNSYAADALCIWPRFDYSGMTDGEQVRELWFHNGKSVGDFTYSWESGESGAIGTNLSNGGEPVPEGAYYLEVYAGADLHKIGTTPEIAVGSGSSGSPGNNQPKSGGDAFTLYGVIYDASSEKPISGAYIFVLKANITYEEWQGANFKEDYVAGALQTGSDGKYKITDIPRGVAITYVFSAQGYYDYWENSVVANDQTPDLVEVNVGLSK